MAQLGIIPGLCDSKAHLLPIKPCRSLAEHKSTSCGLQRAIIADSYGMFKSRSNQAGLVSYDPMGWYTMTPFFRRRNRHIEEK